MAPLTQRTVAWLLGTRPSGTSSWNFSLLSNQRKTVENRVHLLHLYPHFQSNFFFYCTDLNLTWINWMEVTVFSSSNANLSFIYNDLSINAKEINIKLSYLFKVVTSMHGRFAANFRKKQSPSRWRQSPSKSNLSLWKRLIKPNKHLGFLLCCLCGGHWVFIAFFISYMARLLTKRHLLF